MSGTMDAATPTKTNTRLVFARRMPYTRGCGERVVWTLLFGSLVRIRNAVSTACKKSCFVTLLAAGSHEVVFSEHVRHENRAVCIGDVRKQFESKTQTIGDDNVNDNVNDNDALHGQSIRLYPEHDTAFNTPFNDKELLGAGPRSFVVVRAKMWSVMDTTITTKECFPHSSSSDPPTEIAWHPTRNWLAIAFTSAYVCVWDVDTRKPAHTFVFSRIRDQRRHLRKLGWSPDGSQLMGSNGIRFGFWNVDPAIRNWYVDFENTGFFTPHHKFSWAPHTTRIGGRRKTVRRWLCSKTDVSIQGTFIAIACHENIELWDVNTRRRVHRIACGKHVAHISAMAWSPHGPLLAVMGPFNGSNRLLLINLDTFEVDENVVPNNFSIKHVADFSWHPTKPCLSMNLNSREYGESKSKFVLLNVVTGNVVYTSKTRNILHEPLWHPNGKHFATHNTLTSFELGEITRFHRRPCDKEFSSFSVGVYNFESAIPNDFFVNAFAWNANGTLFAILSTDSHVTTDLPIAAIISNGDTR